MLAGDNIGKLMATYQSKQLNSPKFSPANVFCYMAYCTYSNQLCQSNGNHARVLITKPDSLTALVLIAKKLCIFS